ncbi:hypothetical protein F4823DRAFT_558462 [Ustulina deusta]|nr:hypothetical protein F4823DRAFT_558462 [Ustulina deusta]
MRKIYPTPEIIHIKSVEQASGLNTPYYIVGTVPDSLTLPQERVGVGSRRGLGALPRKIIAFGGSTGHVFQAKTDADDQASSETRMADGGGHPRHRLPDRAAMEVLGRRGCGGKPRQRWSQDVVWAGASVSKSNAGTSWVGSDTPGPMRG